MQRYIIIHYGEIYLKGGNRKFFEDKLIRNIESALADCGNLWLRHVAGRIIILIEKDRDFTIIKERLVKVFGIEYFTFAWNTEQDYQQIEKAVYELVKSKKFKTFRISTRRNNKNFPLHSNEVNIKLGDFICQKMKKKVDLENFDLNIQLDIVRDYAFIYFEKIDCRGGLPVGVSGKLIVLLSGGIDSPVAANLMQKRGAEIVFVNFDAYPATPKENQQKVKDLTLVLAEYQSRAKLYLVPFLDIQKEILKKVPEDYRVIFYRRMMLRIASLIAAQENSLALVTGESLGQVASQTVENISAISEAIDMPVLRPLIGFNKEEIITLAKEITTYEISAQPFADCCSLYVPKHPVTHADINLVRETEKNWNYRQLLAKALAAAQILTIPNS